VFSWKKREPSCRTGSRNAFTTLGTTKTCSLLLRLLFTRDFDIPILRPTLQMVAVQRIHTELAETFVKHICTVAILVASPLKRNIVRAICVVSPPASRDTYETLSLEFRDDAPQYCRPRAVFVFRATFDRLGYLQFHSERVIGLWLASLRCGSRARRRYPRYPWVRPSLTPVDFPTLTSSGCSLVARTTSPVPNLTQRITRFC